MPPILPQLIRMVYPFRIDKVQFLATPRKTQHIRAMKLLHHFQKEFDR
jgi:hypothetical protein